LKKSDEGFLSLPYAALPIFLVKLKLKVVIAKVELALFTSHCEWQTPAFLLPQCMLHKVIFFKFKSQKHLSKVLPLLAKPKQQQ